MEHAWPRRARFVLSILVIAYLLPGLLGHEPWKPDEPYTFGIARMMLATGDWLVPHVGDVPFVEKPPLFYWAAAAFMRGFPGLAAHDAARLATMLFMLLGLGATAAAARLCWGAGAAPLSILLLLATLGLEGHAQRLQVDHALFAGYAVALLGFAGIAHARRWGGAMLGAGVAVGFLSKGLLAPATLALAALLLPAAFAPWRRRAYAVQLAYAALVALPVIAAWPAALWLREPALFDEWFWNNNVGRFAGFATSRLGSTNEPGFWLRTLPWFLFPLWVFVFGALRVHGKAHPWPTGLQIGFSVALITLLVLLTSASGRAIYALPLLPALALMGAGLAREVEGPLGRFMGRASIVLALVAGCAVWSVWVALYQTGSVPEWSGLQRHFPLPFAMPFDRTLFAAAIALTAGFGALVAWRRRLPRAGLTLWVGALSLAWGLAMTLWLPWIDAAKGYREVFEDAARHLPADASCVIVRRLGESERAMVDYYMPVSGRALARDDECPALLWVVGKSAMQQRREQVAPAWRLAWSGRRRGEDDERFELYLRAPRVDLARSQPQPP